MLSLPDRLPVLVLCLGVASVLAVLVGQFRPVVVLPLALLGAVATWRLVPAAPARTPAQLVALLAVVVLCVRWLQVSLRYVSSYVVVNRDPGFLTLQALWLVDHPSAPITVGGAEAAAAAAAASGASAGTEAFWLQDGLLYAQGNKMLPALLAVQGWLGGERAVLAGNLTIGVVALVAVFALARRFAGPLLALVPTTALALCLPMLVFTRAAYTEPLTVAFLCGGLALLRSRPRADGGARRVGRWALAGAMLGAVGTARIDGAVVLVGLAIGCALVALTPLGGADRRAAVRSGLAALLAGTAMVALGLLDVSRLSPDYLREHTDQVTSLLQATGLVVVLVVLLLAVPARLLTGLRLWAHRRRRGLGAAAAGTVLVVAAVLASRPLWWQGRYTDPDTGYGIAVTLLQTAAGQTIDASRSYDEQTVTWVTWYLGVPAVVLGFVGLAVLAYRAVAHRDAAATLLVAVVSVAAVFPLVRVSITPDQIWAVRRLLPATFPGLLVAGSCGLAALAGPWRPRRGAAPARAAVTAGPRTTGLHAGARRAGVVAVTVLRWLAAAALGVLVAVRPMSAWNDVAGTVELSGRDTQAHAVCDALADAGVDRVIWVHSSPFRYLATLRVICDVEVVEFVQTPTAADLAAVVAAWGGGTVAVASFDLADVPWSGSEPTTSVGGTVSTTLGRTLTESPSTVDSTWSEIWIGLVQQDGTAVPLDG